MSVINESGVSSTTVRLKTENNYVFDLELAAVDGSLHEFFTDFGQMTYIVVSSVFFSLCEGKLEYRGSRIKEAIVEGKGEEVMRRMEYEEASSLNMLVLMDRKITMDLTLGMKIPPSTIAIVKDFDQMERKKVDQPDAPWLMLTEGSPRTGYVKLSNQGWVFRLETNLNMSPEQLLALLYSMSREPIPEALGYNYPLFLADKMAKYYRDKSKKALDFLSTKELSRYRTFRSLVEGRRRIWNTSP
ncbi:DNA double-strand break repair nuclease NurA [Metallosphaera hakonensis]|uniref:NurA domain-containing protein n=1 Tax=Metallosphaera hakonensis JCM 8857 = DSM 7519 TaxID=1293036 RepID=A0A2U9IU48_9CREN|nr:DNA double-strand break repair nuclease NurA [Metallosphaera hakonensis]AWR99579.1 hypothetical protein DFR87_07620 [Metallosphaera hakonensis JCM 8857 = DSM 7519]